MKSITKPVIKLGIAYFLAYVAYDSLSQAMYMIYRDYDLSHLSLLNLIFVYIGFGPGNFISSYIIVKVELKSALLIGFFGYFLFELFSMGMGFYLNQKTSKDLSNTQTIMIYILSATLSLINGLSSSFIWIVNPSYLTSLTNSYNLASVLGIFWSVYIWANVIGPLITIFVLGKINTIVYFIVLCGIGGLSCLYTIIFLPNQKNIILTKKDDSIFIGIKKMLFLINKDTITIWLYVIFAALSVSFYPIFINVIIKQSLGQLQNSKIYELSGYVFLAQGIIQVISGLSQKAINQFFRNNKKLLSFICILIQIGYLMLMLNYQLSSYSMCFATIIVWGFTQILIKTTMQAYIRQHYKGKMEYYAVNIVFFSIGACICYAILSIMQGNNYILLFIFSCLSGFIGLTSSIYLKQSSKQFKEGQIMKQDESQNSNIESMITKQEQYQQLRNQQ